MGILPTQALTLALLVDQCWPSASLTKFLRLKFQGFTSPSTLMSVEKHFKIRDTIDATAIVHLSTCGNLWHQLARQYYLQIFHVQLNTMMPPLEKSRRWHDDPVPKACTWHMHLLVSCSCLRSPHRGFLSAEHGFGCAP